MSAADFAGSFLIALLFVLWPFAGKYVGVNGPWLVAVVLSATALGSVAIAYGRGELGNAPDARAIFVLVVVGLLNGVGCYLYARQATNPSIPTAAFVTSVTIATCIIAPLIATIALKQAPQPRQWLGFACAAAAVYFLR